MTSPPYDPQTIFLFKKYLKKVKKQFCLRRFLRQLFLLFNFFTKILTPGKKILPAATFKAFNIVFRCYLHFIWSNFFSMLFLLSVNKFLLCLDPSYNKTYSAEEAVDMIWRKIEKKGLFTEFLFRFNHYWRKFYQRILRTRTPLPIFHQKHTQPLAPS